MFKIKLKDFEGPFDLLLYFIKRDELDIYDIPIAPIAEEFLAYIRMMQIMDIELASEFLVMASTLLQIKAEMLLRQDENEDGDVPDENDPRLPLVEKLLEYKKFKEASKHLSRQAEDNKYRFYRKLYDSEIAEYEKNADYKNATVFSLLTALEKVMKRHRPTEENFHHVNLYPISVDDKKGDIWNFLQRKSRMHFLKYIENFGKMEIVVSFLAILEMARANQITLFQDDELADIIVTIGISLN
jgi:segregation and condensation protein A